MAKVTILFVATNSITTKMLDLEDEVHEIRGALQRGTVGRNVEFVPALAVRGSELMRELNENTPRVVHFSGHGCSTGEMVFRDEQGQQAPLDTTALRSVFASAGKSVAIVVLNACHSVALADEVVQVVSAAVGMQGEIGDRGAIVFATHFYDALAYGLDVTTAFEQGKTALMIECRSDHRIPVLRLNANNDSGSVRLCNPPAANSSSPSVEVHLHLDASTPAEQQFVLHLLAILLNVSVDDLQADWDEEDDERDGGGHHESD